MGIAESVLLPVEMLLTALGMSGTLDNTVETAESMISRRVISAESLPLTVDMVEYCQSASFSRRLSRGLGGGVLKVTYAGAR